MEHFRILPTDQRMKNLNERQIEILYYNFLISPTDEEIKNEYRKEIKKKSDSEDLKDLGYSKEELEQINKAISEM